MNYLNELEQIWIDYENENLSENLKTVIKRGYYVSKNCSQKDILITGINPSFRNDEKHVKDYYSFECELINERWDRYWGPLKKILFNKEYGNLDYRESSAYIDLFSFREQKQLILKSEILKSSSGIIFIARQLALTQRVVEEVIKPKVIIVKNKESAAYWGRYANDGLIWMGYKLEKIEDNNAGEIFRVKGFLESNQRINIDLKESNLENSIILFSHHINQYTKKEKRPTPETITRLFEIYNQ